MKAERFRDLIKNIQSQLPMLGTEELRRRYAIERFLVRLSLSNYQAKLIVKGGFLIGVNYGIDSRATKDLDTLLREMQADKKTIEDMLLDISRIDIGDNVGFVLKRIEENQEHSEYGGYRAIFDMRFIDSPVIIPFDLDVGIGDKVTPKAKIQKIDTLFSEQSGVPQLIEVYGYPKETSFAEKIETVITKGLQNTRMKDFYDLYMYLNDSDVTNSEEVRAAIENTWLNRHKKDLDTEGYEEWLFDLNQIKKSTEMSRMWNEYASINKYVPDIAFSNIIDSLMNYLYTLVSTDN